MSLSELQVLVVEDDEPKLHAVQRFFETEFPTSVIVAAKSLTTAIEQLSSLRIDLAIVDMSLPTYDFSLDKEGGGRPQGFGGEDIVRFVESESTHTKSVVLTQYEEFEETPTGGRRSLASLTDSMRASLGPSFLGVLHYSGQHGEWRDRLRRIIETEFAQKNES